MTYVTCFTTNYIYICEFLLNIKNNSSQNENNLHKNGIKSHLEENKISAVSRIQHTTQNFNNRPIDISLEVNKAVIQIPHGCHLFTSPI